VVYEVPKPGTMDWHFADAPQRELTDKALSRLASYVAERRALVRPFFKSLDPHNNGHLPRSRFRQGLTISELHCTEAEMQAPCMRFYFTVAVFIYLSNVNVAFIAHKNPDTGFEVINSLEKNAK